jgi:hypothetical protein
MLYEDKSGELLTEIEVLLLSKFEIEARGIHACKDNMENSEDQESQIEDTQEKRLFEHMDEMIL